MVGVVSLIDRRLLHKQNDVYAISILAFSRKTGRSANQWTPYSTRQTDDES